MLASVNNPANTYKIDYDNNFYVNGVSQGQVSSLEDVVVSGGATLTINGKHEFNTVTVTGENSKITQDGVVVNPQRIQWGDNDYSPDGNGSYESGWYKSDTLHVFKGFIKLVRNTDYNNYEYLQSVSQNPREYYCNDPYFVNNILPWDPDASCKTDDANFVFDIQLSGNVGGYTDQTPFILKLDGQTVCNSATPNYSYSWRLSGAYQSCYINNHEYGRNHIYTRQRPNNYGPIPYVVSGNKLPRGGQITIPFEMYTYAKTISFDFVRKEKGYPNNPTSTDYYEEKYATLGYNSMVGPSDPAKQAFYLDQNRTQMGLQWYQLGGSFYMTRNIINDGLYTGKTSFKNVILGTSKPVNADNLIEYGETLKNSAMFKTEDYIDDVGRAYNFSANNFTYPSANQTVQRNGFFSVGSTIEYDEITNKNQVMLNTQPTVLIAKKITINGGSIDVSGKGYGADQCVRYSPHTGSPMNGAGPGGGIFTYYGYTKSGGTDDSGGGGGGFGGKGGRGHNWIEFLNQGREPDPDSQRGGTYGKATLTDPDFSTIANGVYGFLKGSAGAGGIHYNKDGNNYSCGSSGGGGLILITKQDIANPDSDKIEISNSGNVNGKIFADGASSTDGRYGSAGSGGLILIKTNTLSFVDNRGTIAARGGKSPRHDGYEGPGGGGRLYIVAENIIGSGNVNYEDPATLSCKGTIGTEGTLQYCGGGYSTDNHDGHEVNQDGTLGEHNDSKDVRIVATRGKVDKEDNVDARAFFPETSTFYADDDYRASRNEPGTVFMTNDFSNNGVGISVEKSLIPNPTEPGTLETFTIKVTANNVAEPITITDNFNSDIFQIDTVENTTSIPGVTFVRPSANEMQWILTGRGNEVTLLTFRVKLKDSNTEVCNKVANYKIISSYGQTTEEVPIQIKVLCSSSISGDIYGGDTFALGGIRISEQSVITSSSNNISVNQTNQIVFPDNAINWDNFIKKVNSYLGDANLSKVAKLVNEKNIFRLSVNLNLDGKTNLTSLDLANTAIGGLWQVDSLINPNQPLGYYSRGTIVVKEGNIELSNSINRINVNSSDNLGIVARKGDIIVNSNPDNPVTTINASLMAPTGKITINGAPNTTLYIIGQLIADRVEINQVRGAIFIQYNNLQQSNPLPVFGQALNITDSRDSL